MDDEFMMHEFKMLECRNNTQHNWKRCCYFHPDRRDRRRQNPYSYKHHPCPYFESGHCLKGDRCKNAHGPFEAGFHPHCYKTELCGNPALCAKTVCFFAHSNEELRRRPPSIEQQQQFLNEARNMPNSSMFASNTHIPAMHLSSYPNSYMQQQQQFLNGAYIWPNASMSAYNIHIPRGVPAMYLSSYPNSYMQQQQQFLNGAYIWPNASISAYNTRIPAMNLSSYPNSYMQQQQFLMNEARSTNSSFNQSQQQRPSVLPLLQAQTVDHPSPSIPTNDVDESSSS